MLPNFLIVGAGKSGTTSIYRHLKAHPEIYMPDGLKEPRFFIHERVNDLKAENEQFRERYEQKTVRTLAAYEKLFEDAGEAAAIGEASVSYLYFHESAIPQIQSILGETKIVIFLRNPVDRAFSSYLQQVRDLNEPLSFDEALAMEKARQEQGFNPVYFYADKGMYYRQVKAYMEAFEQVKVILFDDMKRDLRAVLASLYEFLEVETGFVPNDIGYAFNKSGRPKSAFVQKYIYGDGVMKKCLKYTLLRWLPETAVDRLKRLNLKRETVDENTRRRLQEQYEEDIAALEKLIGRDLSGWRE